MILLASDLNVVADGVEEGRRTFANILKYVRMGSSSNFGNMLSMAVASLFLPFLPHLTRPRCYPACDERSSRTAKNGLRPRFADLRPLGFGLMFGTMPRLKIAFRLLRQS